MKKISKTSIFLASMILSVVLINIYVPEQANGNEAGAPAGKTGSPGDGSNCSTSGCHTDLGLAVTASNSYGFITTNIPAAGYTPGTTYTITAKATVAAPVINSKFGFQISPQNAAGAQRGTLIITNTTETQLVGSGKYITHKLAGTGITGANKSWTFNWTAPATGQGPVTFYGAFLYADANNANTGDSVVIIHHTVNEVGTIGINEYAFSNVANWLVYPSPATDAIQISNTLLNKGEFEVMIYDITGKKVKEIKTYDILQKPLIDISKLTKGVYIIAISSDMGVINRKIIKS